MVRSFKYFLENPVQTEDGFHLTTRDAQNIAKYLEEISRAQSSIGILSKKAPPFSSGALAAKMYIDWNERIPKEQISRALQADVLRLIGFEHKDGFLKGI